MAAIRAAAAAARRAGYSGALTMESMNQRSRAVEYAVRGPLVTLANELKEEVSQRADHGHPFEEVTMCNIGNPQALGQLPLTFPRQVLACCFLPELMDNARTVGIPDDVVERAATLLASTAGGTVGSYSNSKGIPAVRHSICRFLEERDGSHIDFDPERIFCLDGAGSGAAAILTMAVNEPGDGVLLPIPQYPLYSAVLTSLDAPNFPYYLDEANGWSLSVDELRRAVRDGRAQGHTPRCLVVINPGNPTGQCLSQDNIRDVLEFARSENLVVLADEVYQENVYAPGKEFISFRHVLATMPDPHEILLASLHSISKGFFGECGLRGGYLEVVNMAPEVLDELYKMFSVNLCPNLGGQVALETMVNPPRPGDPSYETYVSERDATRESLLRRAVVIADGLNQMDGVTCNEVEGAMYAFPTIRLPAKFVAEAERQQVEADALYADRLLRATGVCVVPGSGFGQEPNTFHFRTSILPPESKMPRVLESMRDFHTTLLKEYAYDA